MRCDPRPYPSTHKPDGRYDFLPKRTEHADMRPSFLSVCCKTCALKPASYTYRPRRRTGANLNLLCGKKKVDPVAGCIGFRDTLDMQ